MTAWQLKAAKDSIKAALPFQDYLRRIKRSVAPYESNPHRDKHLLGDSLRQIAALRRLGITVAGQSVVELGSGWVPILPLTYSLFGAGCVVTVDQERLIDEAQIARAAQFIQTNIKAVSEKLDFAALPPLGRPGPSSLPPNEFLRRAGVDYRAPFNFLQLPHNSADLVVSRDVLEHIPEATLTSIVKHSFDILRPGGIACHTIDMSDHWQHVDDTISKVNFLQYDGVWWKLAGGNPQNFQNRLRLYEYVDVFRKSGFKILEADGSADAPSLTALDQMRLCQRYRSVPKRDLAIISATIIAQRI